MRLFTLKKNREFRKIFNDGRSVADRYLVMYILKREDMSGVKFGFSVSKKIGKAVVRNAVRRKLKEICRLNQDKFLPGAEIILIARAPVVEADFVTLKRSILGLAGRAKIFKKES